MSEKKKRPKLKANDPGWVDAPTLAECMRRINLMGGTRLLVVEREIYDKAFEEHEMIQFIRGFPPAIDFNVSFDNFLLHGVVITHG